MSLSSRWNWVAASMVLVGVLTIWTILPGCSQAPAPEPGESQPDTTEPAPGPDTTEPAPEPDTTEPAPGPDTTEPAPGPEPGPAAAIPPDGSKVSTYAPAEDLVGQVEYYVDRLETAVGSEEEYNDSLEKIARDSNTLAVIFLALGLHDEKNKYDGTAALLLKQSQQLAAAADYASAKAAVAAVKGTMIGASSPYAAELKWEKVASLPELMKQVPLIDTKLKGCVRRLERRAKDGQGHSAVIAAIGQASMTDTPEPKDADRVEQWRAFCVQMRDAAAAVNAGIRGLDKEATAAAMKDLTQSCDDCHEVFHPVEE